MERYSRPAANYEGQNQNQEAREEDLLDDSNNNDVINQDPIEQRGFLNRHPIATQMSPYDFLEICGVINDLIRSEVVDPSFIRITRPVDFALFYHNCGRDRRRTELSVTNYVTMKSNFNEIFANTCQPIFTMGIQSQEFIELTKRICVFPLKVTNPSNDNTIIYMKWFKKEEEKPSSKFRLNFMLVIKYFYMVLERCMYFDGVRPGYEIVFDLKDLPAGIAESITRFEFVTWLHCISSLPINFRTLHLLHAYGTPASPAFRALCSDSPFKRYIRFNHTFELMFTKIDDYVILPNESGGRAGDIAYFHEMAISRLAITAAWYAALDRNVKLKPRPALPWPPVQRPIPRA